MTNAPTFAIADADMLDILPDGSIISWLRIPGDETSEAVALLRRGIDPDAEPDAEGWRPLDTVTWVSPGGWAPQSVESAGVNFPAQVVRWGTDPVAQAALDFTCESGGTVFRSEGLAAAVRMLARDDMASPRRVLEHAEQYAAWLAGDLPTPQPDPPLMDENDAVTYLAKRDAAVAHVKRTLLRLKYTAGAIDTVGTLVHEAIYQTFGPGGGDQ